MAKVRESDHGPGQMNIDYLGGVYSAHYTDSGPLDDGSVRVQVSEVLNAKTMIPLKRGSPRWNGIVKLVRERVTKEYNFQGLVEVDSDDDIN